MDVADVLRDRMDAPSGLQRMVTISLVVHAVAVALLAFGPGHLVMRPREQTRTVMTISLGGAGEGPRNGGFTAAASQPVQVQRPPEEAPKREAARPPAAKTPEMVLPTKTLPARKTPAPVTPVKEAPDDARGRTPTKGAQTTSGNAVSYTGARGQGFGLSTGGGAGSGSTLDVADFCCPDYIATMVDRIRSTWQPGQGTGHTKVKFTIERDGRITGAAIEASSGTTLLDTAALRAVLLTRTLNPLPAPYPYPTLGVHLDFEYK